MRLPVRWREWAVAAGAATAFVLSLFDLEQHYTGAAGVALAFGLARALLVLLAWTRPLPAVAASLVLELVNALVSTPVSSAESWPWPFTAIACHVALLIVLGARCRAPVAHVRAALAAAWIGTQLVGGIALLARSDQGDVGDLLPTAVLSAAAVVIGELVRSRAQTRSELVEQARISADELASRLRSQERSRIARELHDVVAHHLSVVVVRADSAGHRVGGLSDEATAEFAAIGDEARASLEQMRRVLRLLRSDSSSGTGVESGTVEPQPGLAEIAALVTSAREAGTPVSVTGDPTAADLDDTTALVAHRVVQEALTNAMRHAPGSAIDLAFDTTPRGLAITVGNPAPSATASGSGYGLQGMRERVESVDGRFGVDTRDGRFTVTAELTRAGS